MLTAILGIVSAILKILDRYLEERHRTRIERENDEFRGSVAKSNLDRVADNLAHRLREYKARHPQRQRTDNPSSDRPA